MSVHVALLRGVNVGGHNRVPMAELRAVCEALGWSDVRTYIQSGNIVFRSGRSPDQVEAALERAIAEEFGLVVPVIARTAELWSGYVASNPFPGEAGEEPNRVMLGLAKSPPSADSARLIQEHAADGERVALSGDALWIYFPAGSGRSRITPAVLDRHAGAPVTMRNWRTVLRLLDMAGSA